MDMPLFEYKGYISINLTSYWGAMGESLCLCGGTLQEDNYEIHTCTHAAYNYDDRTSSLVNLRGFLVQSPLSSENGTWGVRTS